MTTKYCLNFSLYYIKIMKQNRANWSVTTIVIDKIWIQCHTITNHIMKPSSKWVTAKDARNQSTLVSHPNVFIFNWISVFFLFLISWKKAIHGLWLAQTVPKMWGVWKSPQSRATCWGKQCQIMWFKSLPIIELIISTKRSRTVTYHATPHYLVPAYLAMAPGSNPTRALAKGKQL